MSFLDHSDLEQQFKDWQEEKVLSRMEKVLRTDRENVLKWMQDVVDRHREAE